MFFRGFLRKNNFTFKNAFKNNYNLNLDLFSQKFY